MRQAPARNLLLKIGIHEGPCLAVTFDDRQDYFGQTVNIASRVLAAPAWPSRKTQPTNKKSFAVSKCVKLWSVT